MLRNISCAPVFQRDVQSLPNVDGNHPSRRQRHSAIRTVNPVRFAYFATVSDSPVPHTMPENIRCLAITAGKRAAPSDLHISLSPRKGGIRIRPDAGNSPVCTRYLSRHRVSSRPCHPLSVQEGGEEYTLLHRQPRNQHILLSHAGMLCMRATNYGYAVCGSNLVRVLGCIDRVETVAGHVILRGIDRMEKILVLLACRRKCCIRILCCVNQPPVNLHMVTKKRAGYCTLPFSAAYRYFLSSSFVLYLAPLSMLTQTSIRSIGPLKGPSPRVESDSTWSPFLIPIVAVWTDPSAS